tara:strand:- start:5075 stop:5683 length:609 start_codon:yes stop_codon:yes gene_type:complete
MQGQEDTSAFIKQVAKLALRHTTPGTASTHNTLLPKEMRVRDAQTGDKRLPTMPEAAAMVMLEFASIDAVRKKVNAKHNEEALSRKMHEDGIWLDGHLNSIMTAFAVSGALDAMGSTMMTHTNESMNQQQTDDYHRMISRHMNENPALYTSTKPLKVVATPVSDDTWNDIAAGASFDGNLRRRVREESPHDADADTDADPKP